MKKVGMFFVSLFLTVFSIITLISCGGNDEENVKLPENKYEKVSFAFNGVEKSLKKQSSNLKSDLKSDIKLNAFNKTPSNNTINTIFSKMEETGKSDPGIEYNDTPLIQFQYLKVAYEKFGDKLNFDTKYSYNFQGDIYYDFDIDDKVDNEDINYKHHYDFTFSIIINIDDNDLITAFVGMDVTFTQNDISRHEYMYADLVLDYDMNEKSPTYKFMMKDITDLLSFPEDEQMTTCEYNYIDVDKNTIKEFRKFGIASKESLDNYQNDDFTYKYNVLRGFRNNKEYKLNNPFIKDNNLKEAVIEGLGLKNSFDSYKTYFNNPGTTSNELKEVIDNFNNTYGSDFVYHIATSGKDEEWEDHSEPVHHNQFIALRGENDQNIEGFQYDNDFKFKDIMNGNHINLYQDDYEILKTYNSLDEVVLYVDLDNEEYKVEPNDFFIDFLKDHYNGIYESEWVSFGIILEITSPQNEKIRCYLACDFMNTNLVKSLCMDFSKVQAYINKYLAVKDIIPTFSSTTSYYRLSFSDYDKNNKALSVTINAMGGTEKNKNDYIDLLLNNEFTAKNEFYSGTVAYYEKRINENYKLRIDPIYNSKGEDEPFVAIVVELKEDKLAELTISEYIENYFDGYNFTIPENKSTNYKIQPNPTPATIMIDGATLETYQNYVKLFKDYGFTVYENGQNVYAFQYINHVLCMIQTQYTQIVLTKTPIVFSFVGTMNNWDEKNTDYEFETATTEDIGLNESFLIFTYDITFNENDSFKVVINHDWSKGEFSYNQLSTEPEEHGGKIDETPYYSYFESEGEYHNIKVLHAGTYRVKLYAMMGPGDYDYQGVHADRIRLVLLED